ncbi:hypothetical protein [Pseudoxanthomonas winnipegensis]|uniref:Uncharacterized protein n=1 Tax=Pseudoxanthomonas winnipegensis TaxID=2480810 RepID=A0A4Q8L5G5_9GAMM|nr:hypothetical protein [Pseudoxanthomonas winnipegensis]TAA20292.1 hypothetical protein EA660_18045 [Pseudoxanthomonas winnipegensis]
MDYRRFLTDSSVISRSATFSDGTVDDVHFIKCSHLDFEKFMAAEKSSNPAEVERAKQRFIAAVLVNPDGTRAMSDDDSIKLTAEGVSILLPLALETSGIIKRADPGNAGGGEAETTSSASSP